jgi:hypothetical protein
MEKEETEGVIAALATKLDNLETQPTKLKKRRERLRLKKFQKKTDEIQAKNEEAQKDVAVVEEKNFPFLLLPAGKLLKLPNTS